ncbi:MAG TPA: hypothetical protein VFU02_00965 [Polyangiaceae bacterium]|nr:hypothetical protein [Polyangiaceae bacterium]
MTLRDPGEGDRSKRTSTLLGLMVSGLVGSLLFVPLWAGLNYAFGTALDGPIGAFIMEPPCQRLAGTTEPLSRYTLGTGTVRVASSVCHFASGPIHVDDRPTDGLGFRGRELVYLLVGFVGYAACLAGAVLLSFFLVRAGRLFFAFALRWLGRRGVE